MRPIGSLAVCLALVSGTAQAQTTITREITSEPVETVITRGPDGAAITRRILSPEPGVIYRAPPVGYAPASVVETEDVVEPATTVTTRRSTATRRVTTAPARQARTRTATTRTAPAARTRTVARTTTVQPAVDQAVVLTPAQRQVIYRTIAPREVYPAPAVVPVAPPVVAATEVEPDYPLRSIYPADDSYSAYGYRDDWRWPWDSRPVFRPAPVTVTYVVGSRLPQTVPLVAVPNTLAARVPGIAPYSYAMVGDRVYLVDPATSVIVADVTQ